jgi:hypothetical protein
MVGGFATAATAGAPAPVDVIFTVTSSTTIDVRVADGTTFITMDRTGVLAGTFGGTTADRITLMVRSDGTTVVRGAGTCACSLDGLTGTMEYRLVGSGVYPTSADGRWLVYGGTGGLTDLHAEGPWTTTDFVHAELRGSYHLD